MKTYDSTKDRIHEAKTALIGALRAANDERLPARLVRQLESITGRLEILQAKIAAE